MISSNDSKRLQPIYLIESYAHGTSKKKLIKYCNVIK